MPLLARARSTSATPPWLDCVQGEAFFCHAAASRKSCADDRRHRHLADNLAVVALTKVTTPPRWRWARRARRSAAKWESGETLPGPARHLGSWAANRRFRIRPGIARKSPAICQALGDRPRPRGPLGGLACSSVDLLELRSQDSARWERLRRPGPPQALDILRHEREVAAGCVALTMTPRSTGPGRNAAMDPRKPAVRSTKGMSSGPPARQQ
jgi:hypothetical protein